MVLLQRLEDVLLDVGHTLAHRRVYAFVLDVRVHREELDHLIDEPLLGLRRIGPGLLKVPEHLANLFVVVLEQYDRVRRHIDSFTSMGEEQSRWRSRTRRFRTETTGPQRSGVIRRGR